MTGELNIKRTEREEDLVLVKRAKRGDYRAFDLLVIKYQSRVVSVAFKYVKEVHLAEDISQEAFIKAYKALESFREESAFYTWIYRITANTALNYLSSKSRKHESSFSDLPLLGESDQLEVPSADSPEELLMAQDLREIISKEMSRLPEDTRTALSLREFEGLNYEEISKIMNCPVGTVRSRISRGREALQEVISSCLTESKNQKDTL
jgi:RNA polymerase sigma-70 factor (ECF subfamily)